MKYNLIFYIAKKTSYCEKAVRKALLKIDGEVHRIIGVTAPVALGEEVARSLKICPLTVIVGGFNSTDDDNLATVLSRVFSKSPLSLDNMRKLTAVNGMDGYIVRYKTQILLALPDSPEAIGSMFSQELLSYISDKVSPKTE